MTPFTDEETGEQRGCPRTRPWRAPGMGRKRLQGSGYLGAVPGRGQGCEDELEEAAGVRGRKGGRNKGFSTRWWERSW